MRKRKGKAIDRGLDSHESSSESEGVAAESSSDESSDSGETLTKEEAKARSILLLRTTKTYSSYNYEYLLHTSNRQNLRRSNAVWY